MPDHEREEHALEVFCRRMSTITGCDVIDTGVRPDRLTPGPTNPDAILRVAGREWSVEHRSLDSFRGMRRDTTIFMDLTGELAVPIAEAFPEWMLWLIFDVHSWPSLPLRERDGFRAALLADVLDVLAGLPSTMEPGRIQFDVNLRRTALPLTIQRHAGEGVPLIMRCAPADQRDQIRAELVRAIEEKNGKRARQADKRQFSMLLLDSDDLSMINEVSVHDAFASALTDVVPTFDHIFLVRTRPRPPFVYPLWTHGRVSQRRALHDFRRAQGSMEWGDVPFGAPMLASEVLVELGLSSH